MPALELEKSNEEFALAAADLIDRQGLAIGTYRDRDTGCYCTLGAFRMLVFGSIMYKDEPKTGESSNRYYNLVSWFSNLVKDEADRDLSPSSIIANWNDARDKETVVAKLREAGAA